MPENMKAKFRRVVDEAWNKGILDSLDELHATNYVEHRPPFQDVVGLDAFKQTVAGARQTFPDFHITIDELILEGDKLAVRFSWTGTHLGQSQNFPIPPTGKQLVVTGSHILHLGGEKLIEGWQFADNLGLLQQLGLVPQMG
jgi:predicted ester cyclase